MNDLTTQSQETDADGFTNINQGEQPSKQSGQIKRVAATSELTDDRDMKKMGTSILFHTPIE